MFCVLVLSVYMNPTVNDIRHFQCRNAIRTHNRMFGYYMRSF